MIVSFALPLITVWLRVRVLPGPPTQSELIRGRRRLSRSNWRKRGPNHGNCAFRLVKWQFT